MDNQNVMREEILEAVAIYLDGLQDDNEPTARWTAKTMELIMANKEVM